jgi:hypothetical protein
MLSLYVNEGKKRKPVSKYVVNDDRKKVNTIEFTSDSQQVQTANGML